MMKKVYLRAALLISAGLSLMVSAGAATLPPLIATNFGSFAVRNQTSLVNNDPGVNSSYSLVGGGNELWGPQDKGLFGFFQTTGDFDVRVRVESLEPVHRYAKTGLMVRESLSSTARMVSLFATPTGPTELPPSEPMGEDEVEFNFRRGVGDGSNNINLGSPGYPNAWLRLARRGTIVYGLVSRDGINWTRSASVDTSAWLGGALKPNVLLGLGSSSHEDDRLVESELRDFSEVTDVGPIQILTQPSNTFGVIGSTATLAVEVDDPVDAEYQWFVGSVSIPGATNATYTTPTLTAESDESRYTVRIIGANGTASSTEAVLSVVDISAPEFPTLYFDFDDGEVPIGSDIYGTAEVDPNLGIGGSGGLILTRAVNQQNGAFVVQDFNGGALVEGFTVAFKLKIGPGSAKPADGFSFSFGPDVPDSVFPAPQQGVGKGLSVSFDIYDNNNKEAPAIDVFYGVDPSIVPANYMGNVLHRKVPLSDLLQSRFVDVVIRMNPDGKLDLLYDGQVIAYQIQTPFAPVADGKFGFGAYAGGQNAFHAIDEVKIETLLSSGDAYVSSISPLGNNVSAQPEIVVTVVDQFTEFDAETYRFKFNGDLVTPVLENDPSTGTTTLSYQVPSLLLPGSTNTIALEWSDGAGTQRTNTAVFLVGSYVTLPVDSVRPSGSENPGDAGFRVRIFQTVAAITPTSQFAESVLAGERGDNVADPTIADPDGYFTHPSVTTTIDYDVYSSPLGYSTFPGIPGPTDSRENFVGEVLAYIKFPQAGFYQMGVRSDDGFILKAGDESNPVVVGAFEGERGSSESIFGFLVPQAGLYPFRLVYYQATGGASLRWFSITPEGEQVLINAPENPQALQAYRTVSGGEVIRMAIARSVEGVTLTWQGGGVLEATSELGSDDWTPVTAAASPYSTPLDGTMKFFRVRK